MGKVLGFSKRNLKYADIPDGLKWAISIHECLNLPDVIEASRTRVARAKQKVEAEAKHERFLNASLLLSPKAPNKPRF